MEMAQIKYATSIDTFVYEKYGYRKNFPSELKMLCVINTRKMYYKNRIKHIKNETMFIFVYIILDTNLYHMKEVGVIFKNG